MGSARFPFSCTVVNNSTIMFIHFEGQPANYFLITEFTPAGWGGLAAARTGQYHVFVIFFSANVTVARNIPNK